MYSEMLGKSLVVTNGTLLCAVRRRLLPGWQQVGETMPVRTLSRRGLDFAGLAAPLPPGTRVRLDLHIDDFPAFPMEARVIGCERLPLTAHGRPGAAKGWSCAVEFTSYDENTWANLRAVEEHLLPPAFRFEPLGETVAART